MKETIFYVYGDYTEDNNVPFYFGKGKGRRFSVKKRNKYWKHIADKHGSNRIMVLSTKDESYALEMEVEYIKKYKTFEGDWEDGSGWGANFTRGGDGVSGWKHSEETKEKLSILFTGENSPAFGTHPSPETLEKMRIVSTGRITSEETKEKQRNALLGEKSPFFGIPKSDETKRKLSEALSGENHPSFGKHWSEETKKKMSEAQLGEKNHMFGYHFTDEEKKILVFNKAKLTKENVLEVRELIASGIKTTDIAKYFNVSVGCISKIKSGERWSLIK